MGKITVTAADVENELLDTSASVEERRGTTMGLELIKAASGHSPVKWIATMGAMLVFACDEFGLDTADAIAAIRAVGEKVDAAERNAA